MTTRHLLHDAGHCLRVAAPPVLALAVLTATRSLFFANQRLPLSAADSLQLASHGAIVAAASWLVASLCWSAARPWRDRRASQRLRHFRDLAAEPNRALVHLQTTVWSGAAGQHSIVVNVATGVPHRVWIAEMAVPIGAFVVLERADSGVSVLDWMNARQVKGAHRYERRHPLARDPRDCDVDQERRDEVLQLIEETEQYLRQQ